MSDLLVGTRRLPTLKLSRWGKSSYETNISIEKEKTHLENFVDIVDDNSDADIVVVHSKLRLDEEMIQKSPSCKYVITTTSGYDHIECSSLHKRNIKVIRMPLLRRDAVVETTLGLMLQGTRRIQQLREDGIQQGWLRGSLPNYDLLQFKDLRIGVVGSSGIIGSRMIEILSCFGCKEIYHCDTNDLQSYSFDEIASICDIITLHCDLNPSSYHICDASFFHEKIKTGTILINTARGGLIDEASALDALQNNTLSFLGLDVFEREPYQNIQFQKNHPNLVFLPHAAGFSNTLLDDITKSLGEICSAIANKTEIPHLI
jgi:lactate dehydrogenase-like 2-hydroxyacid dehydrogenase